MEYMGNQNFWEQKFLSRSDSQLPPETILIEDAAFFKEKGSVLDLACGDGRNALFLAGNGFEVTAVDFSEAALSRLKRFAEKERLTVYTQQMDLCCEENFDSLGKFDMIVCNHYRLLSKTAMQLKKHLTKNGILWLNGFAECPQDNADTFFGNMGKIVCKLKTIEPNARIFVVTPQLRGEACDKDIRYIASELAKLCDMFDFTYLLDMTAHAPVYDAEMRKSFGLGFHPNPMGYYAYALMVANYIDYVIRSNPREFATIPFVGTSLKNKDYK